MRYLLLLIMVFMPTLAMSQNNTSIIEKINAGSAKIKSLECDFVQTKHLKIMNNRYVSRGKLYYAQPDMLRWEYTAPYSYIFIMNQTQVLLKSSSRSDIIDVNQNKMFKEISRLMMSSIKGESLNDNTTFQTKIAEVEGGYTATLTPLKREMKQMWNRLVLHFDAKNFAVNKIEMHETTGDNTVIELKNVVLNGVVEPSRFNLK